MSYIRLFGDIEVGWAFCTLFLKEKEKCKKKKKENSGPIFVFQISYYPYYLA